MDCNEYLRQHGHEDGFESAGYPEPTRALPGSEHKIGVMRRRVEDGLELHSPYDVASIDGTLVRDLPDLPDRFFTKSVLVVRGRRR